MKTSIHKAALRGAASLSAFALLAPIGVQAQVNPAPAAGGETADEPTNTIIVTGSRIARPELKASVPVAVVSSDTIANAGHTNVMDALKDIPIVGQSLDRSSSNFSNFDNGVATVNLRNLGSQRTLVLINGRRSVGIPGSSTFDLNNIPSDLIDHVEIATGGTSAVYGSDAVAGVVNLILKNNFTGLEGHAQSMISNAGDGARTLLSATGGTDFAGGAGHVVVNFSYTDEKGVPSSARGYSRFDSPSRSSYAQQGLFDTSGDAAYSVADGNTYTFDAANNVKPYQGAAIDGYNRASNRLLTTPVKRYSASLLGHYEMSDAADFYVEFTYNKTKARNSVEPLAVDDQGVQGQSVYNFDGTPFSGISITNPYMPPEIAAAAATNGQSIVNFRRRSNGIFDRSAVVDRDYYRGVIGVKGDIGSGWKYDLSYEHSQVRDDTLSGAILMNNYGASLDATTVNGQIVCANLAARAAGCVPINIFGYQNFSPALLKWLSTYSGAGVIVPGATVGQSVNSDFLRKNWQDVATLSVTGSLFNLPGGPVGVALGGEFHREKSAQLYDPFTQAGISSFQQEGNTIGKYNSKEAFLEINAPIFGGKPLLEELSVEGAVRYANYTTVGSVWSYKYGGTYAPSRDIRFRAIYARAVRAPNINELYQNPGTTAPQVIDPCDQNLGHGDIPAGGSPASATIPAACLAIPGISTYLQTHPYFAYSLAQIQTVTGLLGGNPNLEAEKTNTFTAGLTFTPTFFRNFYLTADYYSIKVNNAVAAIDQQVSVTECFLTGSPEFCNNVIRNSSGFITAVNSLNFNAASYRVAGIDVQSNYVIHTKIFNPDDMINLSLYYNHKFKQSSTPFAGGPVENELGTADTYAGSKLGTGFKDQFTFNLNFTSGAFSLAYRLKYLGPVTASEGAYHIPAFTYHDLQAKVAIGDERQFEFYVGADNLFNKQPPFIATGDSQWPGTNTVADTYDLLGRMFYAGVRAKFK